MRFTLLNQVFIALFVTKMLVDAASLTTHEEHATKLLDGSRFRKMVRNFPRCFRRGTKTQREFMGESLGDRQETQDCVMQENTKNVNDMISGNISLARFETTKSTLMENDGKNFHAILGTKKHILPNEIGINMYNFFHVVSDLILSL
jgi:hypothetical protein